MSGVAILKKEGLEFKDAMDAETGLRNSLGTYTKSSVQYNNDDVFNFDGNGLNFAKKVTSVTSIPQDSNELVTKGYVDGLAVGLNVIKSCEVATNRNIFPDKDLKSGLTINGVILVDGMRVLVWKQSVLSTNGIYVIDGQNNAARSSDFDETSEIKGGVHTFVTGGSVFADCGFVVTNPNNNLMSIGESNIEWAQFSKSGVHTFNEGLETAPDGFTISVDNSIARTANLNNEVNRATAAEDVLRTAINDEVTRATGSEDSLGTALAAEVTRATASEGANSNAIAAEVTRAVDVEDFLRNKINNEIDRSTNADVLTNDKLWHALKNDNAMVFSNSDGTKLTSYPGFYHDSSGITVPNVTTTSDETKKRDIKELSDSDLIYKLRPVEYKWKDENMDQRTKYGFIAQEVLEIFPSMVTKQNGVYGIEYINLISHLVKEVQILREEVNSMKN